MGISISPSVNTRTTVPTLQATITSTQNVTIPAGIGTVWYIASGGGSGGNSGTTGYGYAWGSGGAGGWAAWAVQGLISGIPSASTILPIVVGSGGGAGSSGGSTYVNGILVAPGATTTWGGGRPGSAGGVGQVVST